MEESKEKYSKMFVSILPSSDISHRIKVEADRKTLHVQCLQDTEQNNAGSPPRYWHFTTDGVFYKVTQEDIYSSVMDSVLSKMFDGAGAVIVCCGQAGSGKSYTSFGVTNEFHERGLAPRVVTALFDEKTSRESTMDVDFRISFLEFRGNNVLDLLKCENLQQQISKNNIFKSALSVPVNNEEEALKLIFEGMSHRAVNIDAPYPCSNRGHGVLTIQAKGRSKDKSKPIITLGVLHVIDLAGISSPDKNGWANPQDIGNANLTKTFLEHVLIEISNPHCNLASLAKQLACPLIHYLGSALSSAGILRFIGHIHGSHGDLDLSLSTLRFVEKVNAIKSSKLKFCTRPCPNLVLENFEDEEMDLWKQFRESTMLAEEPNCINISQARVDHFRRLALSFLEGEASEETILSEQQTPIVILLLKEELQKVTSETARIKYKIDHLQFDGVDKTPSGSVISSPSRDRGKGRISKQSLTKDVVRGPRDKKKSNDSKEVIKRVMKSSKESAHSMPQNTNPTSKLQESREVMRTSRSASLTIGRTPSSPKRLKRVVSQANKKSKSKEVISKIDGATPVDTNSSIQEELMEKPVVILITELPSQEDAWEDFLKTDVSKMQTGVHAAEEDMKQAHISYSKAVVKLTEARHALVQVHTELVEAQHERHLRGYEAYDPEGRILTGDAEQKLIQAYEQRKAAVDVEFEMLKSAKVELDESIQRLSLVNKQQEDKFEEFCLANYQVPILPMDEPTIRKVDEPRLQHQISEHRIKYFHALQQTYFSSTATCTTPLVFA